MGLTGWLCVSDAVFAGQLTVNATAKYKGTYGLNVTVNDTVPAYVEDNSPAAESRYRSRFYVQLLPLSMAGGDEFVLFTGLDASSNVQFEVIIRRNVSPAENRLVLRVREDAGTYQSNDLNEILLEDGWHAIEIDWKASDASQANGFLSVWVNGQAYASSGLSDLDNETAQIDLVRLGAVDGIDVNTSGSFKVDEFASRREGYIGLVSAFGDVADTHLFWEFIHAIYNASITSGCTANSYCPDDPVNRGQMAVFLLRGAEGGDYVPPACTTQVFDDVPCSHQFARWINELAARGITSGCAASPPRYCPSNSVTRGQMAVFLLRAAEGAGYAPPVCTSPTFPLDVPCTHQYARWINELAARAVTSGCGTDRYCPNNSVTRGQMAVFLTRTFGLPMPQQ